MSNLCISVRNRREPAAQLSSSPIGANFGPSYTCIKNLLVRPQIFVDLHGSLIV